jgi:hypothetical protein
MPASSSSCWSVRRKPTCLVEHLLGLTEVALWVGAKPAPLGPPRTPPRQRLGQPPPLGPIRPRPLRRRVGPLPGRPDADGGGDRRALSLSYAVADVRRLLRVKPAKNRRLLSNGDPGHRQGHQPIVVVRRHMIRLLAWGPHPDLARLQAPATPDGAFVRGQDGKAAEAAGGANPRFESPG